jgi:hypothetical protein
LLLLYSEKWVNRFTRKPVTRKGVITMPEMERDGCVYEVWLCVPQEEGFRVLQIPESEEHGKDLVEIFDALSKR